MKLRNRLLSAALAVSLLSGLTVPAAAAAAPEEPASRGTGSISATLRIDYPQTLGALKGRNVSVELKQNDAVIKTLPLGLSTEGVTFRGQDGGEVSGDGEQAGYVDFTVSGLERGTYAVSFTGVGYVPYEKTVTLDNYSQHLVLGTSDAFALGDFDGDGEVDETDRDALSGALGTKEPEKVKTFDLNGDGEVDITDLAYVIRQMDADEVKVKEYDTACINVQGTPILGSGTTLSGGTVNDLLLDNGKMVTFKTDGDISEANPVSLELQLTQAVETEELRVVSPTSGAPQTGVVWVEDEDGIELEFPFDISAPAGLHAIGRTEGKSVVVIPLGKRVPVKKITIQVTKSENDTFVTMESIQFLKDIVPENPVAPNSVVQGLKAVAGDKQAALKWNELPNVERYQVDWWPTGDSSKQRSLQVQTTSAEVTGLENLVEYTFIVTPTDSGWSGKPSAPVTATPQPASAPKAPDMVTVTAGDASLAVSWKQAKDAAYYEVYYSDQENAPTSDYILAASGLTATQTTIAELTNGVTYYIYVVAGNEAGKSGPSRIYTGTPVTVKYERPAGIPQEGVVDAAAFESIQLAAPNNYDPTQYTAEQPWDPAYMADGDYKTSWTSGRWNSNEHVEVTFKTPQDLSAVIWVPRLDSNYASRLRAYSVRVWYDGEVLSGAGHLLVPDPDRGGLDNGGTGSDVHTWPNIPNLGTMATDKFAILPFSPVKNVKKISVAAEQSGYQNNSVTLSELMFLKYDPARCLPDNITALFADDLHTQLVEDVNQAKIDELKARLNDERNWYVNLNTMADELALAEELLNGKTRGVVLNGIESRNGGADSAKYGQGGSVLQPLGVTAKAGSEITVYASGIPEGQAVTVYATQYFAEANAWQKAMGTLTNGRNILSVPQIGSQNTDRGGSLYLTYSGASPEKIKLHVRRAVDIPVLELANWYALGEAGRKTAIETYLTELSAYVSTLGTANRQTNCLNVTELSMPSVLLSIPADVVLNSANDAQKLYDNVLAWEDLMHICKTTQGIDNTYENSDMQTRQNIRCMQMFTGAFMYAAGSHIGIGYGSCGGMVSGKPISQLGPDATANSLFGWGIAHEIGHNMDKLGRAEITNNIYSLMVQTYDGKQNILPSRLEKSNKYPAAFNKTAQGYAGASNDVFVQLAMYWQLHLAYDEGDNPMAFYNQFFKAWKAGTYTAGFTGLSYDDKVALTAAGVAEKDLTEFFTRWGMRLGDEVKKKLGTYEKEDRAVWYLSDQSRRDRLTGTAQGEGTVSVTAKREGDTKIVLAITSELTAGKLQGYEIRRDGKSIAFTTEPTFTDVIGSANHRTYEYSVVAYDILGNVINTASAVQVRVAYDKTVDPSAYTLTRVGDTATFTFQQPTAVTGLKLSGADRPASGDFTVNVTVKSEDGTGSRTVTARSGRFDEDNQAVDDSNSFVSYFQKPRAGTGDTRVWTYDAMTVTVTGIPAAMKDEDILLVSYAGDDVAFLEDCTAGVLRDDYTYTDAENKEQVIPAGTLVITGTYRGDPLWSTIKIKGRFTVTGADEEAPAQVERYLDGYTLLFAEVPEDGAVSDISDGIFLFVPNVQREAELQEVSNCTGANLLPSEMMAELARTDEVDSAESQRVTAQTLWVPAPGGAELPVIVLE